MSFRKSALVVTAAGLAAALALTPAFAQGMGAKKRFEDMDTNHDNKVSADEHAAWQKSVFDKMDADKSGDLTEAEYMAVRMGPGPHAATPGPRHAERQARKKERFKKMDTNGDGKVSEDEFLAYGVERFHDIDANGDGFLSYDEMRDAHWDNR